MKRTATMPLREAEVAELVRICDDGDPQAALAFAREHLQEKIHQLLEGG